MIRLMAVALVAVLMAPAAMAQTGRNISVAGEGRVEAVPDMATVSLGVVREAREAGEAMAAASAAAARVLDRLTGFGIDPRDIQTRQLSLDPIWSSAGSNGRTRITGFTARNMLAVRVRDLDRLGTVLDALVEDGANDFNGLDFAVAEPAPLLEKARARAVADARAKAAQLAAGAGVTLGPVQSISEQGGGRPSPRAFEMAASREAVPIAAGEVSLSVTVSMVFAIED